jgi:hypothetical protein
MKEYRTNRLDIMSAENHIYLNLRKDIQGLEGNVEETIILNHKMDAYNTKNLISKLQKALGSLQDIKDESDGLKIFVLNEYLKLKLEKNGKTNIYVVY